MSLCSIACASKTLHNYSLSISSGLHPRFVLWQFYNNKLIHQFYEITHAERLQMTLDLIIFASKGPCSETKHSIMQNHQLNLKYPQNLLLKKDTASVLSPPKCW